jgi:uncharacterized protein (TIGR03067 family)
MRTYLFAALLVAAASPEDPIKKEWKELEGTWTVVATDWLEVRDKDRGKGTVWVVHDEVVTLRLADKIEMPVPAAIDPVKTPKAIDLFAAEPAVSKAPGTQPTPVRGIYELKDDTLRICWNALDTTKRPTAFPDKPVRGLALIVLERERP